MNTVFFPVKAQRMRPIGFLLVLCALLFSPVGAQAQSLSVGVKGGFNFQDFSFDEKDFKSSNRLGYFFGPTARVLFPLGGLSADISALYDRKESKVNGKTIKQESILVPVNGRIDLGVSETAGIYVAAGPQVCFNVGEDDFEWDDGDSYRNTFQLKKSTFSVNLGAGIFFTKHFEIGGTYNVAMGKTADVTWGETTKFKGKAKTWTLSATYYF